MATSVLLPVFAEMLLQSREGDIDLLARAAECLADGNVSGLKARGGYEVDMGGSPAS